MRYFPRFKTCEEIIVAAGFTHTGPGMGWEKTREQIIGENWMEPHHGKKTARLHALIHYGHINIHLDKSKKVSGVDVHKIETTHLLIQYQMRQFKQLDWKEPSLLKKITGRIKYHAQLFTSRYEKLKR